MKLPAYGTKNERCESCGETAVLYRTLTESGFGWLCDKCAGEVRFDRVMDSPINRIEIPEDTND